jgi:protease I
MHALRANRIRLELWRKDSDVYLPVLPLPVHGEQMIRAVILVEQGFQDEEFIYPYYRMLEEGWTVDVAAPSLINLYHGKYGVPARTNKMLEAITADEYDLVIIPGGFECPDRLRMNQSALRFVRDMHQAGKLVAAICHGLWVPISAGIVKGKNVTCYQSIKDDAINAGAFYYETDVEQDGNLISADHYKHNGEFMRAIVEYMNTHKFLANLADSGVRDAFGS